MQWRLDAIGCTYAYALFDGFNLFDLDLTPEFSETSEISETDEMYGIILGWVAL